MPIRSWEDAELRALNNEQWRALEAVKRGNVLVSAGAGSGKTHTVVATIAWQLGIPIRGETIRTPLSLDQIAGITFTNRAAADLTTKLRQALLKCGLTDQAYDLDVARIGTIHGFCGDVLREFALRTGTAPATSILEEGEAEALRMEVVRDVLLAALERRDVEGLDELLRDFEAEKVTGFVGQLASDADRTALMVQRQADHAIRERALIELAQRTVAELSARLVKDRAVDFDRMIVRTRDLLRDNEDIRRILQQRIRLLIVDEFQDVDPVQQEIAKLLGSGPNATRLMLVGDAKQSIYRFRRADVTLWRSLERQFADGGAGAASLSTNYRSNDGILAFVEASVGRLMMPTGGDKEAAEYEVPFAPLRPDPEREHADRTVEAIVVPAGAEGEKQKVGASRELEARAIARRILELHVGERRWKDFALLLSSWSDLEIYLDALRSASIPAYALHMTGFYKRREVLDCVLALRVLLDPTDDAALVGWLRSPFVGVTDETLLRITRDIPQPYARGLGRVTIPSEVEASLLARGRNLLDRYSALRDRIPTAELLHQLLDESGYMAHLALLGEDGKQPMANLRKFLRIVDDMREAGVADVLRAVAEARERELVVGDERLYDQNEDVVTISSIHSAKGLEWPVVFWCDLNRSARGNTEALQVLRDQVALRNPDVDKQSDTPEFLAVVNAICREEDAERKRLWYVAATRAAERLVLSGIPQSDKPGKGSPAAALLGLFPALAKAGTTEITYTGLEQTYTMPVRAAAGELPPDAAPDLSVLNVNTLPRTLERISVPFGRGRHSATELMLHERCRLKHWFKYIVGISEPAAERSGSRKDELISAVTRGQITHEVLERLSEEHELDDLLEDAIGHWDPDAPPPDVPRGKEYRAVLRRGVEQIAQDPSYRQVADLPGARRELEFLALTEAGAAVQGALDLAAPERGGYVILDVKMGGSPGKSLDERMRGYSRQVDTYVSTGEALTGAQVNRFVFEFGVDEGPEAREVEITSDARADIAGRLKVALGLLPLGAQDLAEDGRTCGGCGYRRVGWCTGVRVEAQ